jgi:hypothetical protein
VDLDGRGLDAETLEDVVDNQKARWAVDEDNGL